MLEGLLLLGFVASIVCIALAAGDPRDWFEDDEDDETTRR